MDFICQIMIPILSGFAIWFVGCRTDYWKKWGYIFGLGSQPFWFYLTILHRQWGILALSCWYTFSWFQGIWNYWVKPQKKEESLHSDLNIDKYLGSKIVPFMTQMDFDI